MKKTIDSARHKTLLDQAQELEDMLEPRDWKNYLGKPTKINVIDLEKEEKERELEQANLNAWFDEQQKIN